MRFIIQIFSTKYNLKYCVLYIFQIIKNIISMAYWYSQQDLGKV